MSNLDLKVSIIIPVYNVEKYLKRCLESACNQTLQEIEIICIDDFSTDSSAEILQKYSKNYQNLKIINLEKNRGVSFARNVGLASAQGEYLIFIDGDDEIDLNFCQKLYEKAKEENSDVVKGRMIEVTYDGKEHVIKQIGKDDKFFFLSHWSSAIYKRALIAENNISFSLDHLVGEDDLFLNTALIKAKDLKFVDDVYYRYHRREDSGHAKILSEEKIKSSLSVCDKIINNINSSNSISAAAYRFIFHNYILWSFYLALRSDEKKSKQLCAAAIIRIFEKCRDKDGLKINFATTAPNLFEMLKNDNKDAIEDLVIKCKSRMEILGSGLRARVNK